MHTVDIKQISVYYWLGFLKKGEIMIKGLTKTSTKRRSILAFTVSGILASGFFSTHVYADSLLAPLIINTGAGASSVPYATGPVSTYLNLKLKGKSPFVKKLGVAIPVDELHYVWIKKGQSVSDLMNLKTPCRMIDNMGYVSANDMVFQDTGLVPALANRVPSGLPIPDMSRPNTYYGGDFVGMLVITDKVNTGKNGSNDSEGDMSGFAYIVDAASGDVVSYKLLNNHHSAAEGDFSGGFISKKSVDFSWLSSRVANKGVVTGWTAMVTGPDMARHTGLFSDAYDATVSFSQKIHPDGTQDSPLINGQSGVFNNDEGFTSANPHFSVTCMGSFTRTNLLGGDPQLLADTANGGWMRMSIAPKIGSNKRASGAIVYRDDVINAGGVHASPQGSHSMIIETSGHLAKGANHANRPY